MLSIFFVLFVVTCFEKINYQKFVQPNFSSGLFTNFLPYLHNLVIECICSTSLDSRILTSSLPFHRSKSLPKEVIDIHCTSPLLVITTFC